VRAWLEQTASDWPEEGRLGQLANFEVRSDGTIAPWLTFERHIAVLRGLWEHSPAPICSTISAPGAARDRRHRQRGLVGSKAAAVASALGCCPGVERSGSMVRITTSMRSTPRRSRRCCIVRRPSPTSSSVTCTDDDEQRRLTT
jgi:hypothetical protein